MPSFAIVTVVQAPSPEEAWESVEERLLGDDEVDVVYLSAPWRVPCETSSSHDVEYDVDTISLRLNAEKVDLRPVT